MQKENTTEQKEVSASESLSAEQLQDARQLINVFLLAWKNYGLYPEDHTSTTKSFENLLVAFDNYFTAYGDLRLTIEKDRLLCGSEIICEVLQKASLEDMTSLLYRDGIKWIEFHGGLTLEEIASFFRIVCKYNSFTEEAEGDIVTALIDEELEYIDFKAVDIFWQDMLLMDFSRLPPPAPPPRNEVTQEDATDQNKTEQRRQPEELVAADVSARSITDPSIAEQLELSSTDYEILQQMVQEEESWDITEDLFEALLIILNAQTEKEKFDAILCFISEEVVETIELDKFNLLAKLFRSLDNLILTGNPTDKVWKTHLIDSFFHSLSRPEIFQLISDKLLTLQSDAIDELRSIDKIFHYFSPEVVPYLIPVITQRSSPEIQQLASDVIVRLSQQDIEPLEKIAEQQDKEDLGEKLLVILTRLEGERVNEILFKMCNHASNKVQRRAINELVDRDPQYAQRLFPLIDDPNKDIRNCVLASFVKHKSSALENMLLNYLKGINAQKNPEHILACYRTLGRCSSNQAVPFLSRILLNREWNSFMGSGKLIFREGAAIALALLGTPEARDVLNKATKSKSRVIRKAIERTKSITVSWRGTQ